MGNYLAIALGGTLGCWARFGLTGRSRPSSAAHHPKEVVEGLEIVASLAHLQPHSAGHAALCRLAARHPAHAVRSTAKKALLREPAGDGPEGRDD